MDDEGELLTHARSSCGVRAFAAASGKRLEEIVDPEDLPTPSTAREWFGMGCRLHVDLGRYDEAETAYRQAITLDPRHTFSWNNLGNLLQNHLARYEEAEAAHRQAIAPGFQ
ncbi:MAG: tetratricopeptide repeat protein [Chromatiales bacterium]|nr:tetratricopeptide repeat protein [Chromatiales bacterium]